MKLYYYSEGSNFGDAVNPYILENIFGRKSVYAAPDDADLFMIGSILGKALIWKSKLFKRLQIACKGPLTIWSSGFIREDVSGGEMRATQIGCTSAAGELSLKLLEKVSGQKFSPVLGDGGLLIARLFNELPEKKYSVGIVPHFADENLPEIALLQKNIPGRVVISPLGNPLHCAKKIAECETVISSSLHGLIAADSFCIPNLQMVLSNNIVGGLFKYNDYYSVFKTHARPLTGKDIINNGITAQGIRASYTISAGLV